MMLPTARLAVVCVLLAGAAQPADAQTTPRGFATVSAGAQRGGTEIIDQVAFQANAETGRIDARYPSGTGVLFDAGAGLRLWRQMGLSLAVSQAASSSRAEVTASVPHPFFDDRDRMVSGEAGDVERRERAAHLQLFYEVPSAGRWRLRLFGGPSYFTVEQDLVSDVTVDEAFPFDTATFKSAITSRATGSGLGFHAGADASWMFTRKVGAGMLLRYARGAIDLNAPDAGSVSSDGGGLQAGVGVRFALLGR